MSSVDVQRVIDQILLLFLVNGHIPYRRRGGGRAACITPERRLIKGYTMSSVDILVPDLPESVADATVATWHKNQAGREPEYLRYSLCIL
jgi:hypothetical protein